MPTDDEMFPKPHITATDLKGRAYQVTIQALSQKSLWDQAAGEERLKWILLFEEASKYFILNKTNAEAIAEILGSEEANAWIGAQIVIFPTQVQATAVPSTQENDPASQAHSPRGTLIESVGVRAITATAVPSTKENDPAEQVRFPREIQMKGQTTGKW